MFKGQVKIHKNVNGKEENINREFDNEEDFNQFLQQHKEDIPSFNLGKLTPNEWNNFESYLENFFNRRLGNFFDFDNTPNIENKKSSSEPNDVVDLSKYDKEYQRIKEKERANEERKNSLEEAKERLKNYREEFKKAGEDERVKEIDEDLKRVDEELKQLK